MSNQSSTSNDKQLTIQDLIREIEQKSKGVGYIYRGERQLHKDPPHNGKVSSNLWREYGIEEEHFDIELVQKEMLAAAKKHTGDLPQDFRLDVLASPNTVGEFTNAYRNRGEAWLRLQEWEKAKADLTTARDMGIDSIAKFQSAFGSISNFERINDIQLPEDLAALLTPPQA